MIIPRTGALRYATTPAGSPCDAICDWAVNSLRVFFPVGIVDKLSNNVGIDIADGVVVHFGFSSDVPPGTTTSVQTECQAEYGTELPYGCDATGEVGDDPIPGFRKALNSPFSGPYVQTNCALGFGYRNRQAIWGGGTNPTPASETSSVIGTGDPSFLYVECGFIIDPLFGYYFVDEIGGPGNIGFVPTIGDQIKFLEYTSEMTAFSMSFSLLTAADCVLSGPYNEATLSFDLGMDLMDICDPPQILGLQVTPQQMFAGYLFTEDINDTCNDTIYNWGITIADLQSGPFTFDFA